ncbi:MAG: hypothetical protein LBU34_14960 [Planctomycetaceae bacterium]|nr:hypothetical protein [Planctomycetaceae bacterium]
MTVNLPVYIYSLECFLITLFSTLFPNKTPLATQSPKPINFITLLKKEVYSTRAAGRLYSKKFLDDFAERTGNLPMYKRLCNEAVWFTQNLLLGPKKNMDIIADAIRRIQKNAAQITG